MTLKMNKKILSGLLLILYLITATFSAGEVIQIVGNNTCLDKGHSKYLTYLNDSSGCYICADKSLYSVEYCDGKHLEPWTPPSEKTNETVRNFLITMGSVVVAAIVYKKYFTDKK